MTPRRFALAALLYRTFVACGFIGLAALTFVDLGATRAYSTPWNGLFWLMHGSALAALLLRLARADEPLCLPSKAWMLATGALAATIVGSSVFSPYRGVSLLAAVTPLAALAAFYLVHDAWRRQPERAAIWLKRSAAWFGLVLALVSLAQWWALDLRKLPEWAHVSTLGLHRNAHPLGHSNYTAGLAVLTLPWLGLALWHARNFLTRSAWFGGILLVFAMLFSSGSRGGLIGLAALAAGAVWFARLDWKRLLLLSVSAMTLAAAIAYAHPRTRSLIFPHSAAARALDSSNVQRSAMLTAGARMGADRPLLGWGVGTTPLAYPRYRAGLEGGAENVLQLHCLPLQLWADLGVMGVGVALGLLGLVISSAIRLRQSTLADLALPRPVRVAAAVSLLGYFVFSLTDAQLDVPFFAFAVAACTALLASSGILYAASRQKPVIAVSTLGALGIIALFGRPDPTPELNVRALSLATESAQSTSAIELLNASLARNADQEIAHFNLGWLLLVRDSAKAEQHFLAAAQLVPDKGGVYFGLALARLNAARPPPEVVHALALECLNDPLFLTSPWWREPAIGALRSATRSELHRLADQVATALEARNDNRAREARYIGALADWLDGGGAAGEMLARSHTSARVSYFAARPALPDFAHAPIRSYRRERSGYPVLMRNLDLPPPLDLFDVRETILAADDLGFLFPAKGWLPSPLLPQLLNPSRSAK